MTTNEAQESKERLPEHAPRLDWWNRIGVSTRLVPGHYTPGA